MEFLSHYHITSTDKKVNKIILTTIPSSESDYYRNIFQLQCDHIQQHVDTQNRYDWKIRVIVSFPALATTFTFFGGGDDSFPLSTASHGNASPTQQQLWPYEIPHYSLYQNKNEVLLPQQCNMPIVWVSGNLYRVEMPNRRCREKTSYVSNYAFFTLLHEWVDRGQTDRLQKFLCVKFQFYC